MAFVVKDRVKQSTTTTGTGSIVLNGTVSGFQTFANALSDGDTTYYAIFEVSTNEWEVGVGTWTESTTTLARTTVLASSNSNSAIDLSAQAEVFITQPAGKAAFFDPSGDLTLVQDPTSNLQAATKQYVDTIAAAGLHYHDPVRVEQEGNLSATYDNGTSGVGATLTNNSTQAALTIDGVALSLNDRVLIYEQTNGYENGIYTVTNVGSASTNWVLTRATDADSYAPSDPDSLGQGDAFFVLEGTAGAGELYVMNTEGTITFGTTNITFTQVAATAVYTAGTGLTLTGTEFAADGANITNVDAVTLDGIDSSQFLRSDTVDTKTAGNLNFSDNVKAQFGDSSDLQIYHDGTNSFINDAGTGNLAIQSNGTYVTLQSPTDNFLVAKNNEYVKLYYDNAEKLATTSTGVDVTGRITTDAITEDTSGNVGIGATSPAANLDVVGTTAGSGTAETVFRLAQPASTLSAFNEIRSGVTSGTDPYLAFAVREANTPWNTVERMIIDSNGRVGIGTSSPASKFQVKQSAVSDLNGLDGIRIEHSNGSTSAYGGIGLTGTNLTIAVGSGGTTSTNLIFRTASSGSEAEHMRIDSSGQVGIGTSSPTCKLHISGGSGARADVQVTYDALGTTGSDGAQFGIQSGGAYLWNFENSSIYFATNNTERMRIDSSGNLLVGKTSVQTFVSGSETTLNIKGNSSGKAAALSLENASGDCHGGIGVGESTDAIYIGTVTNHPTVFNINNTERMRIDSSGNLLVGTTVNDGQSIGAGSQDGIVLAEVSQYIQRGDNANLWLSKPSGATNTEFIKFYNNSSLVGQIESSGTTLEIVAQSTNFHLQTNGGTSNASNNLWTQANIKPWNNNYFDLGVSNYRWKDLYLAGSLSDGTTSRTVSDIVGLTSSQFLRSDADDSASGDITFTESIQVQSGGGSGNPIRIGNGFGSGGTATIHKYGAPLYLQFGNGQTSTDVYMGGGGTTANLRMQSGYIDNISSAYVQDYIYHQGDTDTFIQFGTDTVYVVAGNNTEITVTPTGVQLGDTGNGYFQPVTGDYGSIQIDGGAHGGYEGYGIGGESVFMSNGYSMGLYDDTNNEWALSYDKNGGVVLYCNGSSKLQTISTGVNVTGALTATTKSFVIDHPNKEGMKLRHGSLEGPEDGVYVRGRLTGETVIELPDYWTGLVHEDSITVQLTAMGGKADLWVESIADNKVTVGCNTEVDCFYFVQATRKDVDAWDVEYVADS